MKSTRSFEELVAAKTARSEQRKAERPGHYIERERVAVVIEKWLEEHRVQNDVDVKSGWGRNMGEQFCSAGAMDTLSFITGINPRTLLSIIKNDPRMRRGTRRGSWVEGGDKYLTIEMVDRLLTGMDMVHLFHLPPEAGGFSDSYLHPSVVDEAA